MSADASSCVLNSFFIGFGCGLNSVNETQGCEGSENPESRDSLSLGVFCSCESQCFPSRCVYLSVAPLHLQQT